MCWEMVRKTKDSVYKVGLVIFRKPSNNECYERRKKNAPPLCQETDVLFNVWYGVFQCTLFTVQSKINLILILVRQVINYGVCLIYVEMFPCKPFSSILHWYPLLTNHVGCSPNRKPNSILCMIDFMQLVEPLIHFSLSCRLVSCDCNPHVT